DLLPILSKQQLNETYHEDKIILPPPPKEQASGEYPIGDIEYADKTFYPFGLREDEWVQHLTIFGRSGSGKTNLVFGLVRTFQERKKPFIIFDWKRNYRDLLADSKNDLLIFTVGRAASPFRFNPLIPPPNTDPEVWLKKLIEIIAHSYFLGEGVIYLLLKTIDSIYRKFNVYSQKPDKYPTMLDVFEELKNLKLKGRASLWLASTIRAVFSMCFGEVGKVFCIPNKTPIESLLNQNVVFELDALTNTDKIFFTEALLLWIYQYRLAEGKRETFKHAMIIEEAHHVLLKMKQKSKGEETITDIILREIRELGESLIIVDQHPSLISPTAIGNSFCTIAMNLKHMEDIRIMDDSMLLNNREFINRLPIGYGIVKLQGRHYDPFLIKIPLFSIKKGVVSDSDIKERMAGYSGYSNPECGCLTDSKEFSDIPSSDKVGEVELRFLLDLHENPFTPVNERYKRLGWSFREGNKVQKELIDREYVKTVTIPIQKGRITLFDILDKGKKELGFLGVNFSDTQRKGGIEHKYWVNQAAEHYKKQGYQVEIEKPIGEGKAVDIVISMGDETIAVEVETGKSDAMENVNKCLNTGFKEIMVIATCREAYQRIKNQIAKHVDTDNVKIDHVKNFMFD
ncbi:MAG: DUF87 domain-containing protein, partial [Candidatus Omnitrophica bacterium]|nr:DUF87 domain-containing protein [Candidatus Omnitrophota bacterium]